MEIREYMEQVSSLVDQVRSKLTEEQVADIGSSLKSIENIVVELGNSHIAVNSEAKNYRLSNRELKKKFEDLEVEKDDYKTKFESFDTSDIERERDDYKSKYEKSITIQKDHFISAFDKYKEHPNWKKAEGRFIIPEEKDGKRDWEKLHLTDWEQNFRSINDLNDLGFFEQAKETPKIIGDKIGDFISLDKQKVWEIRQKYGSSSPEYQKALKESHT